MTLVNHDTGEIIEPLDRAEAERLTTRIRLRLDAIADNYTAVMPLIREAIQRQAYAALGYTGVSQYVAECFGDALAHLGVEVRREVVRELTEAGMSTRAIAPVVGVSHPTVIADRRAGGKGLPPDPQSSSDAPKIPQGEIGTSEPMEQPEAEAAAPAAPAVTPEPSPALPQSTIGLDGKTYSRVAPKPRADDWTDQDRAEELAANLARNVSQLYALTVPDRRAEYIANWHRGVDHRPVLGQNFVTPWHMRELADALNTFASEWEKANV